MKKKKNTRISEFIIIDNDKLHSFNGGRRRVRNRVRTDSSKMKFKNILDD